MSQSPTGSGFGSCGNCDVLNPRTFLWWASIVAESILLARLIRVNLYRKYIWFTAYIVSDIVCSLTMMWLTPDPHSVVYAWVWVWTQPVLLALQLALSIELYRLIAGHYRNFERYRVRLFWTCLLSATAVSALTLIVELRHVVWKSPILQSEFLAKRTVTFALSGFVIATSVFLRLFPISIRSNVTAHRRIATVYFLANAANYCALDIGLLSTYAAGIALMIITGGCFVAWAVFLKPRGEDVETSPAPTGEDIREHLRHGDELLDRVREIRR
jgi:hypothetical protein